MIPPNFRDRVTLITFTIAILSSFVYFTMHNNEKIIDFDLKRDEQFIKNAFKGEDLYWLVENPDFDVDYMLKNKAPDKKAASHGKLFIKVLFVGDKLAGFTTYHMLNFYKGRIQFIYVHPDFRNKGYAKKLTKYASDELFKMGANIIVMVTRIKNFPAQRAYEKIGFKEVSRDDKFIDYELRKN